MRKYFSAYRLTKLPSVIIKPFECSSRIQSSVVSPFYCFSNTIIFSGEMSFGFGGLEYVLIQIVPMQVICTHFKLWLVVERHNLQCTPSGDNVLFFDFMVK